MFRNMFREMLQMWLSVSYQSTQTSVLPGHRVLHLFTHEMLHNSLRGLGHTARGHNEGRLGTRGCIEKRMRKPGQANLLR